MNPDILPILCCPACPPTASLILENAQYRDHRINAGQLRCDACQTIYPIRQGIPRFVSVEGLQQSSTEKVQGAIAQNFGDAWQLYAKKRKNPYTEEQFLDWIQPLTPSDFENQWVLDLGSGLSRFTEYASHYGPQQIVGLEISHAIDAAASLLEENPNLTLIQGNILHPPFRAQTFDLIYSIGVLHHLENPEAGFHCTTPLLKPSGRFFLWVYGQENNGFVVHIVDPLRRLTSKLPVWWVRYGLALPMALLLFPLLHTIYHPRLTGLFGELPYHCYFQWLRKYGFQYVRGMITDQLVPPRTHYLSKPQLLQWLGNAHMTPESITARNHMSWRVLGRSPEKQGARTSL